METSKKMEEKKTKSGADSTKTKDQKLQDDTEMVIESSEDLEVVKSFDDLGLREELLRGKTYAFID
jgi:hypothetical protein